MIVHVDRSLILAPNGGLEHRTTFLSPAALPEALTRGYFGPTSFDSRAGRATRAENSKRGWRDKERINVDQSSDQHILWQRNTILKAFLSRRAIFALFSLSFPHFNFFALHNDCIDRIKLITTYRYFHATQENAKQLSSIPSSSYLVISPKNPRK